MNRQLAIVNKDLEIHNTPLEKITIEDYKVIVEFDDVNEKRWRVEFSPYQGYKATTIDCASKELYYCTECIEDGVYKNNLLEVLNSDWIDYLKQNLIDEYATFLDKSRHLVLPFRDQIFEVVAWEWKLEEV